MVNSSEIVNKTRLYLDGQLSLPAFREWLVVSHLEMQQQKERKESVDKDAASLLAQIEGRYAEFSDQLVSEELWKKRLAELILLGTQQTNQSAQVFHVRAILISTSSSAVPVGLRTWAAPGESSVHLAGKRCA